MSRCLEKSKSVSSCRFSFVLAAAWHPFLLIGIINCTPPENPIKCSSQGNSKCTIMNSIGEFSQSNMQSIETSAVAMASMKKYKVKAATRYSHSQPKMVCPDEIESGVLLRDLIDEAAKVGLALPSSPYWWGLTIGGMISTGAHGSNMWGGSYVHDYVVGLRIVTPASPDEGYAKVRVLDNNHPDLKAAKLSLGVLGIISQVTLKLQPLFKRSMTIVEEGDSDLATRVSTFGKEHEFGDIAWYPYQRRVLYRRDGLNDLLGFRSFLIPASELTRASGYSRSHWRCVRKCISANVLTSTSRIAGFGFTNDGNLFTGYPIVGYLQASGSCLDSSLGDLTTAYLWDSRIKAPFITTLLSIYRYQKLRTSSRMYKNLEPSTPSFLQFRAWKWDPNDASMPRLFEDILEEVEQIAVFKYGGIPHWGKNRNVRFIGAINNANEFLKVKERYDPSGVFFSKWTNQILGLDQSGVTIVKDGCALDGLCICSDDTHCAPEKGYVCRPGQIYTDARVCTDISKDFIHIIQNSETLDYQI
ncbi:hypothetical protein MKX01_033365 [Papaver californicum]|nr:hypothetical protein MKX01_033365 [Papaver californicum]